MSEKEAKARIKINKLLEDSGWRFFDDEKGKANILLENNIKIEKSYWDSIGDDFEKSKQGFIDFLLLDLKGSPLVVLEAKSSDIPPLSAKEQARKYAISQHCRFVILSNGNLHYFWDLERGNPYIIISFPTPESVDGYQKRIKPNPERLVEEKVADDFLAITLRPNYKSDAGWQNESEREDYKRANKLCFLRPYQLRAIYSLQTAVKSGKDRFLFEMATGTGKTSTAAAVIKLFLRTGNAKRVLFLVDRLELEEQAKKAFQALLSSDYQTVVYKENRDDWRKAEIVVTTVQSLLHDNKYQRLFSPTDFDFVISDEAHRSIGGNARAVFDYFIGYKLGLTATPRDYLKHYSKSSNDPREFERRLMLDTYRTFGCENNQPTFRYSLLDGVKDGYLISPTIVDARTDVTTELLSEDGFIVPVTTDDGESEESFKQQQFEKRFFSEPTNQLFCKTFLENALLDPVSREIGKSIVFAVSQHHASKLVQILNEFADKMYPCKYNSDFAVQVTSQVQDSGQFTVRFANNNLLGSGNFIPEYKTSKARVCVTVGMMTTGYDCTDILNIGLFRPIFSPTDFIQIKGRGTRKHNFTDLLFDKDLKESITNPNKTTFKLFDFFANCEYFEEGFNYDQVLKLPPIKHKPREKREPVIINGKYDNTGEDELTGIKEKFIGTAGMKIDRMFFEKFEEVVKKDNTIAEKIQNGQWDQVIEYVKSNVFDKPEEYYTLDKLRKAAAIDRRIGLREILEKIFGLIPRFKTKDEMIEEEFSKFVLDYKPEEAEAISAIKNYFKAYITDRSLRATIETKQFTDLATNPCFSIADYKAVPAKYRDLVPEYVKDYVSLNQFMD